ncbi:MAG TPA: DUF4255 domain-containing protein [Puia sp.]|nr:DUF4255 domain-containing protein [Puia sp.]
MIDTALLLLQSELQNFINKVDGSGTVIVENIGMLETSNSTNLNNNIIISLVNVEEESALKNQAAVKRPFISSSATYQNPPVYLNLYVLFTCNFSGAYPDALKRLGYVIQFLQSKNLFSASSSPALPDSGSGAAGFDLSNTDIASLKFTLELYTLTFEQINHLWGSLGGRQVPFVMYKLRLVSISDRSVLRQVPLIEEIETNVDVIAKN